jgi:radical SAM superfamily enzyme YgiQ (UPF0313 family)
MLNRNRVLLIYPPNQLMEIETPRPDGSLGPLYLAGALELAGFSVDVLDASVGTVDDSLEETFYRSVRLSNGLTRIGMSPDRIAEVVSKGDYGLVGINSNFTPQTRMALEVASIVKSVDPGILVVAGGVNARNLLNRFFAEGNVDQICLTEGERIIPMIAQTWRGNEDPRHLHGIAFQEATGQIVRRPARPGDITVNLDDLPFPAWKKLPFRHYDQISSPHGVSSDQQKRYAPIMTSRGCPFRCSFCHISREKSMVEEVGDIGSLRLKSVERVIEEIDRLKELGVGKLFFEDDSLLAKKERVRQIFSSVVGRGLSIADVNGVNLVHFLKRENSRLVIDREYLELLAESGFAQIVFPVESGSQRILDKYATAKLNLETLDVVELVRLARRAGIICPINMMIGFPDETEVEMRQSILLAKRLVEAGAEYCTFFIPIPFPGSSLFEIAVAGGNLDRNFDPDSFNWKNAVMRNTVVPAERIVELRDLAWREINTPQHVAMRLKASIGARWQDR